jgi:hypothetical protein
LHGIIRTIKINIMSSFKTNILNLLGDIKGNGSFVSQHTSTFQFPGLEVRKVGEIAYPINEIQAKALINNAHKASFGKGSKTILDTNVRNAWEIDAGELTFTGKGWDGFLKKVIDHIKPDLGIEDYSISASLYKMLIYGKGDFFLSHKDSEKEKGMFGTLIIGLPSKHTGGELLVRFDGKEECVDFAEDAGNFKMPYTAFYADCDHEIKPITSGYRVCLVYNLVQQRAAKTIRLEPLEEHVKKIAGVLKEEEYNPEKPTKIILLGHQYTPENFSMDALKLNDRSKGEALLRAADMAGYYAKMCLVTSYRAGMPVGGGYGEDVDEDTEMEEVYDESLSIEHWMDEGVPSLDIQFEEDDLIASFQLDEDEPIVKEVEGYMGNYGPDLMHWYHYGAVLLWQKKSHEALLLQQDATTKLAWIAYYNERQNNLSDLEIAAAESALLSDLSAGNHKKPGYTAIADWLINRNDEHYFAVTGTKMLQQYFVKMDTGNLAALADAYPTPFAETIIGIVANQQEILVFDHYISLLEAVATNPKLNNWAAAQAKTLHVLLSALIENGNQQKPIIKKETWSNLLLLERKLPQTRAWATEMANLITTSRQRNYINDILVAEIIIQKHRSPLSATVLKICREDLEQRVNSKPQPPANWSRALPDTKSDAKQWSILASFLRSPEESVFDYRKNQNERSELEHAINKVTVDLKMETIRKGSPHTLRITKTQAAYQRQMKHWNEDVVLLEKVIRKMAT